MFKERFPSSSDDGRRMIPQEGTDVGYGPTYEFKRAVEEDELPELNEQQRLGLREVLASLGQKLRRLDPATEEGSSDLVQEVGISKAPQSEKNFDPSRRRFFKDVTAGVTVMTAAAVGVDMVRGQPKDLEWSDDPEQSHNEGEATPEVTSAQSETIEVAKIDSDFEKETTRYKLPFLLKRDEIWFVDSEGLPVGEPVRLEDIEGGQGHYSPGPFNEVGILKTAIDNDWLEQAKARQQAKHPQQKIVDHIDVADQFAAAYRQDEEPGLSSAVAVGEVDEFKGVIEYYANKPVIGAEQMTRMEYVQNEMRFDQEVPSFVQNELRKIIPGLCAQESKFNNGLVSKSGAEGIFQFMPKTWEAYGGRPEDFLSLTKQVEIAGEFISDLYKRLPGHINKYDKDLTEKLKARFPDEESFQRDLMIPLVINSYNAGDSCVAEGVRLYMEEKRIEDLPEGKDLFLTIAEFSKQAENDDGYISRYGTEARQYVPRIYAQAAVLQA